MHSHLLPGIDDGSPDIETSEQLISGLQSLGISQFIATPHILWDLYRNDNASIENALAELQTALNSKNPSFRISAAAEYMMDDHFTYQLENKIPLRSFGNKYVLVEFSFVSLPFNWKQLLFDMQVQGYQPVLAHPERYHFLSGQPQIFQEIANMGVLLQTNLNSLTGYYGKPAYQLAQYLIKHKLISFLGTDLHHQRHLDALRNSPNLMKEVNIILDSGKVLNQQLAASF
jgi:tyrosine-protein phosphatase YwqE